MLLEPLGFKFTNRRFYVRITENRVYQSIELCRRPIISMKYLARPLFMGKELCVLDSGSWIGKQWYNYENDAAIHDENVADMARIIKHIWIPYFESTETVEGAHEAESVGHNMGREALLALYKARNGCCKDIVARLEFLIEDSKDVERENVLIFNENGRKEEDIQRYVNDMKERRNAMAEKRDFFANSSSEVLAKYFESNEEEVIQELKWKFK